MNNLESSSTTDQNTSLADILSKINVMLKQSLTESLRDSDLSISFVKKDGSLRVMKCTLRTDAVIPHEKKTDRVREAKDHLLSVWDLDAGAWRSINIETIESVEHLS
jgi:hypothetical protein